MPRIEADSLGEIAVPDDALYGAQTQRAVGNFPVSGQTMPPSLIYALGEIKAACAAANRGFGELEEPIAAAIEQAATGIARGAHADQFPVDIYQTGSGTSTNMNVNEVIATLASRTLGAPVHPNDHVNRSQSSNDVIPTALHLSAYRELAELLLPAVDHLRHTLDDKAEETNNVVKTGRTHLMDAMPIRMSQEIHGWSSQIAAASGAIRSAMDSLAELAIGGTAVGSGVNAPPGFGDTVVKILAARTGYPLSPAPDRFAALSSLGAVVQTSGALRQLAVALMKISNDLRWMNSGPLNGLAEIELPALQPGSSIMPGKVNPVIPESAAMASARVMGNDVTITIAAQSGNFQLNVMLPLAAHVLDESIQLMTNVSRLLADKAIPGMRVNTERLAGLAARNPVLVTALAPAIGYDQAALVGKYAREHGVPIREAALQLTDLSAAELDRLLDPAALTDPKKG